MGKNVSQRQVAKEQFRLDDSLITRIGWWVAGDFLDTVEIGEDDVTRIDCKEQYLGEYSVYWLQVWKGDRLAGRYNARNVDTIEYLDQCDYE
jgi:hypothetical protein